MKLILKYLKPFRLAASLAPLFMLLEVFMDLMQPTLMARIIDSGLKSGDLHTILVTGGLMLIVAVIGLGGGMACTTASTYASTGFGANLRNDLFTKIQELSLKDLDTLETGNLITLLTNDVVQLEDITRMMLRIMIRAPLQVAGSIVMAILISPSLSLVLVVMIPLLLTGLILIVRKAYPLYARVQSCLDRVNVRMQENLAAKRLVKAFVREDYEISQFDKANDSLTGTMVKASRITILIHPTMQIILHMGIAFVLWAGGFLVNSATLEIGKLIAFINYLTQLLWSLMMVSNLLMRISRAQVSAGRIQEVLSKTPAIRQSAQAGTFNGIKDCIEFRDVSFAYDQNMSDPTLSGISFTARPGQIIAILGATGSGKSTLVNLIPRFYDVTSGRILIDGIDLRDFDPVSLRRQVGLVLQDTILFRGSIRRNILYGLDTLSGQYSPEELNRRMLQSASTAMLSGFIENLPEGYNTDVHQRGVNLSGGQKQRIAIARALAIQTPVLIFDDATSALDSATELSIQDALQQQKSTQIHFIITQRISSVITADIILILEKGRLAGSGTHEQLLKDSNIYRDIYTSQYGSQNGEVADGK